MDVIAVLQRESVRDLQLLVFGVDENLPPAGHGLVGVDQQVMDYLADLARIHVPLPQILRDAETAADIGAAQGEFGQIGEDFLDGGGFHDRRPPLGEGQQLLGEIARPEGRLLGHLQPLAALGQDPDTQVVATYVEGFQPGDLLAVAEAARKVIAAGKWVVMYKGGRSAEGQAAASSHTGALAGDWELQKALLKRAGVIVCESMGMFDSALAWLAAFPAGKPSRVAVITNAGYESVVSADLLVGAVTGHTLGQAEVTELKAMLEAHQLQDLVNPRLPLDVTPMANEAAYLDLTGLVARTAADTVVVGLVPLTMRLDTWDSANMDAFSEGFAEVARVSGKRLGVAVEGGPLFEPLRQSLMKAGLPVFPSMEKALLGLQLLAEA